MNSYSTLRMRRTARVAAASVAGYGVLRIVEELLPFEAFDNALGITREYEERQLWRAMHTTDAQQCPSELSAVRLDNSASIKSGVAYALSETAYDRHRAPDDSPAQFTVRKQPSSVPHSGDGCHLKGKCARGTVVSFYQGPVYTPITGRIKCTFVATFSDYVIQLADSYVVDGINPGGTAEGADGTSSLCGALCNHPPAGMQPNVMFYPTLCDCDTLPAASVEALRRISWYDSTPLTFDGTRMQRTIALVALRDLEDEELYVDYRFTNATPDLPDWYSHVEREGEKRDWEPFHRPGFDQLTESMSVICQSSFGNGRLAATLVLDGSR